MIPRAWLWIVLVVVSSACSALRNTPAQDLALDRWKACDRFAGVSLKSIDPEGRIWVNYSWSASASLPAWQACDREMQARQQSASAVATPPAPAPAPAQGDRPTRPAPPPVKVGGDTARAAEGERSPFRRALTPDDFRAYYAASWAVVIGIDRYQSPAVPKLSYAVADARAVAGALPGLGFTRDRIVVLENAGATKVSIERAIYGRMREMGREDRLFVFFAGHGARESIKAGKEGYLLPFDTDPGNLPLTALPMIDLAQIGRRLPVKHVLFALDNCFSGYATRRDLVATSLADLAALTQEPVVQILTAGTEGQPAIEDNAHGIFTKHLLKGLEGWADPDGGGLTALKLATFIHERVLRESSGRQTPQYGKLDGEGEFLFRPPAR